MKKLDFPEREELVSLCGISRDRALSAAEFERLESILQDSPTALEFYVQLNQLHAYFSRQDSTSLDLLVTQEDAVLREIGQGLGGDYDRDIVVGKALLTDATTKAGIPLPEATSDPLSILTGNSASGNSTSSGLFPISRGTMLMGLFAFMVVCVLATFSIVSGPQNVPVVEVPAPIPAQIAQATDEHAFQPSLLKSESGTTRFALEKVGNVVLDGPTEFQMLSPLRAKLNYGKIKVRVTEQTGHGFTIETPDGKVIDRGTEFVLAVSPGEKSRLSVVEGKVNLQIAQNFETAVDSPIEELKGGDGVMFSKGCELERLMSIVTGDTTSTFLDTSVKVAASRTIVDVRDNLSRAKTRKFYEIVPQGFREDAFAFVDRPFHEWNGLKDLPIPSALVGGDYVKTFNQDKVSSGVEITVTLGQPCDLYILYDRRLPTPKWLERNFEKTEYLVGVDMPYFVKGVRRSGVGPGESVNDINEVWKKRISEPGTIVLGPNIEDPKKVRSITFKNRTYYASMYGIVAVPLDRAAATDQKGGQEKTSGKTGDEVQESSPRLD